MAEWTQSGCSSYTMAKAAIQKLAKTAAVEFGPSQIRVNVVQPGWIDTPGEREKGGFTQTDFDQIADVLPLRRIGTPADVGDAVAFLCSEAAKYVTGSVLNVDGGYTASLSLKPNL
eukprot:CAMPEP_0175159672 /NCGR_PEP_ID=MMETSP0087-20121206/23557_1 /TAXON_ID=136419 /ORGANISM="Unknown Unknown, Strain D1" /LENGTH=115 /DNA_ID=CAMNT_0016447757 /DNA_START=455 /DNA_END=802 /DNA_ORIENTATION=+